jgi:glycerol uptake facilitator-like aquaporin
MNMDHELTRGGSYDMEKNNAVHPRRSNTEPAPRSPRELSTSTPSPSDSVATDAFLGRLGGAQRFALPSKSTATPSTPADALRDPSWSSILSFSDFRKPRLWKLALVEGVGTAVQVFLSGVLGVAVLPTATETSVGPVFPVAVASIVQVFLISLFIYTAGPVTGAHFNPLITMGTFTTRLSSLPRTVLYITFQCLGAVVGAYLVRAALGLSPRSLHIVPGCYIDSTLGLSPRSLHIVPGCYIDSTLVAPAEAFAFESVMCFVQLFLAFGLGLDPRNGTAFGPSLAPILIGLSSAMTVFIGSFARPGYLSTSGNPARCLGFMAAAERFTYHWVHWVGPIVASVLNGVLYWLVPPYKVGSP